MVNATRLIETLHTSCRMLDWLQGPSGLVRKISPTLRFDLRRVQPTAILFPIYCSNLNVCLVKLIRLKICRWSWKVEVQAQFRYVVTQWQQPLCLCLRSPHSYTIWQVPNPLQVGLSLLHLARELDCTVPAPSPSVSLSLLFLLFSLLTKMKLTAPSPACLPEVWAVFKRNECAFSTSY